MTQAPIISRHRLPRGYRVGLTALWLAPIVILLLTLVLRWREASAWLDIRLLLPLALMALPALYVWQEGVDILPHGIVRRVHVPRYFAFDHLDNWYYDQRPGRRVLTIWDSNQRKVLECRAAHLTDFPLLLRQLKDRVRYRHWPD
jgi:lysylphosphatidylglycerol synthetase-like protein (DUF2156 family)